MENHTPCLPMPVIMHTLEAHSIPLRLILRNAIFVHIKGKNSVLADGIFRLKTSNIYRQPLENPKTSVVSNTKENVTEIYATGMHTINTSMLCTEKNGTKHVGN